MRIIKLTDTSLILSINQEEDLSQKGLTIISNITGIVTMERE